MAEQESIRTSWILIYLLLVLGIGFAAVRAAGGSIMGTVVPALL